MQAFDADFSLDARQLSMLDAMGIRVWQAPPKPAPELASAPDQTEKSKPNRPVAGIKTALAAPHNIAVTVQPTTPTPTSSAATPTPTPPPTALPTPTALNSTPPRLPLAQGIGQMNWPALQQAVSACQACDLCESRKNTVFGAGQLSADAAQAPQVDWLIVGEAPGEYEDLQGEPFVGQAGKLLDNMLAAMKVGQEGRALSRHEGAYITNVLKCRPPANRNPSSNEVALCEAYLARQIELLRPKIILAMGKFAISSLTGSNEPVGKLRSRVHTLKHATYQAPVIVTYHPAYLLRNLPDKAKAWADLLLAMRTYSELPKQ